MFAIGALLMLLPPLLQRSARVVTTDAVNLALHRDQLREAERDVADGLLTPERFAQVREEIERRVLEDSGSAAAPEAARPARVTALVLAAVLPIASLAVYLQVGQPQAVATPEMPRERHALNPEQLAQMATALQQRLQNDPANAEAWVMLGRSFTMLGRYRDGAIALERAVALVPANANLLADLADVAAMSQNKRFAGAPAGWIQRALDVDPRHVKALSLAGRAAFEMKDYGAARGYWQRVLEQLPADAPLAPSTRANIAEATLLDGGTPPVAVAVAAAGASLRGEVVVSPTLAAQVPAGATLFVFARAAEGPRMPLAIVRQTSGAWPFGFTLDDSQAMAPNLKLSQFPQVVVGARLSKSGNATPQSGDLVGQVGPVAPGAQGVRIVIDRVQP
jgi:cytochrome c-type biogenesis protein CcmH